MDFFQSQDHARRKTRWLVCFFILAVLGIIATLHIIFALILKKPFTDWQILASVSGGVLAVVLIGSLVKMYELSQGGRVVAAMLGGRPVDLHTSDAAERRLINVVEEMAIASGVPVPEIYVLDDGAVNAFAAGHGPGDTAIGVTRGCIQNLTRDELQGVIAHEFSHILNGDMRLNIRLMGLLNGILCIAIIGRIVMRLAAQAPTRSSSSDSKGGGAALVLGALGVGLALFLVGWIGVFFGNLIKAAVSRQREFLADASSVQFTRNPSGIAGALWKIGKLTSRLQSPRADEASHLFFCNGLDDPWMELFATHPAITERISAVAPGFTPTEVAPRPPEEPQKAKRSTGAGIIELAGAVRVLASLPESSRAQVHELHGACAMVYALLLSEDDAEREGQLLHLQEDEALKAEVVRVFAETVAETNSEQRITLIDLAIPTLRNLSREQYARFRENVRLLVAFDGQVHLFEFVLQKILVRHLDLYFSRSTGNTVKYRSLIPLLPDVSVLLSSLAYIGHAEPAARDAAFAAGVRELLISSSTYPLEREDGCELQRIDEALDHAAQSAPEVKRKLLHACGMAVTHDGIIDPQEAALLRAIADSLDCPMPPSVAAA